MFFGEHDYVFQPVGGAASPLWMTPNGFPVDHIAVGYLVNRVLQRGLYRRGARDAVIRATSMGAYAFIPRRRPRARSSPRWCSSCGPQ